MCAKFRRVCTPTVIILSQAILTGPNARTCVEGQCISSFALDNWGLILLQSILLHDAVSHETLVVCGVTLAWETRVTMSTTYERYRSPSKGSAGLLYIHHGASLLERSHKARNLPSPPAGRI